MFFLLLRLSQDGGRKKLGMQVGSTTKYGEEVRLVFWHW